MLLILSLLLGCGDREPAETDTNDTQDTDVTDDLPDLGDGLADHNECHDYEGTPHPGATGYWVGALGWTDSDSLVGYEKWVLIANPSWDGTDGVNGQCEIVWEAYGVKGASVDCGSCDYSITLDAYVDEGRSTCPADLWAGDESYTATYDVRISGGTAQWYFPSGNLLGEGDATDVYLTYTSEFACRWF